MERFGRWFFAGVLLMAGIAAGSLRAEPGPEAMEREEAETALFRAAAAGDAVLAAFALGKVDADLRDGEGKTPLMHAAASGDFATVRELLRAGADARAKDGEGRTAGDFLEPGRASYAPLNLILRAHEFTQEHGRPAKDPHTPHLVVISDSYIDYTHPLLAGNYATNDQEAGGEPGVDDDGNGFVDDVYGWNLANDRALEPPIMAVARDGETRTFLEELVRQMEVIRFGDDDAAEEIEEKLEASYQNPLVRQMGMAAMRAGKLDLNDLTYGRMLMKGSHGTHVAGIVAESSDYQALLHGMTWGEMTEADADGPSRIDLETAAKASPTYSAYVLRVWKELCEEQLLAGRRASDYVRAVGAGVVNMSWSKNLGYYRRFAEKMREAYEAHGADPETIDRELPEGLDLAEDLGLEVLIADAAFFAILFAENPNVLFVIAAGNESENNDEILPSPGYLSRLFPNVITVASHDGKGTLSPFSNYGVQSVQLAAQGERILSTVNAGVRARMSGTSMAAPMVSGIAARIRAENPEIHATEIPTILQASVVESEGLRGKVASDGFLDAEKALTIASAWNEDVGFGLRSAELRRSAPEAAPIFRSRPAAPPGPDAAGAADGVYRIDLLAGFPNDWKMVLEKIPERIGQRIRSGEWESEWVREGWDKEYTISALAGERGNWAVAMDQSPRGSQRMIGYDFDQTEIAENLEAGYRITQLAGYEEDWAIVMETDTGWGPQRFSVPTPFDEKRREWIRELWGEGYDITGVAGDDRPDNDTDGYVVVMTKGTGWGNQLLRWDQPWPADWIAEKAKEGYRITTAAGFGDRWVVVLTREPEADRQITFSGEKKLPLDALEKRW